MEANAEAMSHDPNLVLDYEQIGIDFVLTYEPSCSYQSQMGDK